MSSIKVKREHLLKGLDLVNLVLAKSAGTYENYQSIVFSGNNNTGCIDATNGSNDVSFTFELKTDKEFRIGLKKEFFQAVKSFEDDVEFCFENDNKSIIVKSGKTKLRITSEIKEYSSILVEKDIKEIVINKNELIKALNLVGTAAGTDPTRPAITGIYINVANKELMICACDGYRATRYFINVDTNLEITCIISSHLTRLIEKIQSDDIKLRVGNKSLVIESDNIRIGSMLIGGSYPNITQMFSTENDNSIEIKKSEVKKAIQLLKVANLMDGKINERIIPLILSIKDNSLIGKSNLNSLSSLEIGMDAKVKSLDMQIALNPNFLASCINGLGEDIVFKIKNNVSPITIIDDDVNFTSILLPVRI